MLGIEEFVLENAQHFPKVIAGFIPLSFYGVFKVFSLIGYSRNNSTPFSYGETKKLNQGLNSRGYKE